MWPLAGWFFLDIQVVIPLINKASLLSAPIYLDLFAGPCSRKAAEIRMTTI